MGFINLSLKWNVIKYTLYFLLIPIGYLNASLNWLVILLGPFLLYRSPKSLKVIKLEKNFLIALLFFLSIVLFSGIISIDPLYPIKNALNILSIILACYFVALRLKTKNELFDFLNSIFFTCVVYAFILYYLSFDGFTFNFIESDTFGKNTSAVILFIGLVVNLLRAQLIKTHLSSTVSTLFFYVSIFFTGSIKSILVSTILILSFYVLKSTISLKKIFLNSFFTVLFIIVCIYFLKDTEYLNNYSVLRITSRLSVLFGGSSEIGYIDSEYMTGYRSYLISKGLSIFYENPIIGIGLENTRAYLGTYTHNNFVEILAGTGILGFGFFLYAILTIFWSTLKIYNTQLKVILIISLFCFMLIANAQRIYDNRFLMIFMFSFISIQNIINNERQ